MKLETRNSEPISIERNTFSGVAIAWNDSTEPLMELNGYRETFQPGSIRWDDRTALYLGHRTEGQVPLGRVGAGTLSFESTERGLMFRGTLPDWAKREREALERGDLDGAVSIGFIAEEDSFNNRAKVRTVRSARLHHLALVFQGAYPSATGSLV